jgi:hypothetical protein
MAETKPCECDSPALRGCDRKYCANCLGKHTAATYWAAQKAARAAKPVPALKLTGHNEQDWAKFRTWAISLAGKCCEKCGAKGRLFVRRLTYKALDTLARDDVQVLCKGCFDVMTEVA